MPKLRDSPVLPARSGVLAATCASMSESSGPVITEAARRFQQMLAGDADLKRQARLLAAVPTRNTDRTAVEASAALVLATACRAEPPGWDVLAADVHGLPWAGCKTASTSHGTWARHQACGTIAKRAGQYRLPGLRPSLGITNTPGAPR